MSWLHGWCRCCGTGGPPCFCGSSGGGGCSSTYHLNVSGLVVELASGLGTGEVTIDGTWSNWDRDGTNPCLWKPDAAWADNDGAGGSWDLATANSELLAGAHFNCTNPSYRVVIIGEVTKSGIGTCGTFRMSWCRHCDSAYTTCDQTIAGEYPVYDFFPLCGGGVGMSLVDPGTVSFTT